MPTRTDEEVIQKHSVHTLIFRSLKRTHDMFLSSQASLPPDDYNAYMFKMNVKAKSEYGHLVDLAKEEKSRQNYSENRLDSSIDSSHTTIPVLPAKPSTLSSGAQNSTSLVKSTNAQPKNLSGQSSIYDAYPASSTNTDALTKTSNILAANQMLKAPLTVKPSWHPPWKLYRVISGHFGWVRCVDVEPGNEWFATGASDRIIKIWDLATGTLKLSLTGHISTVRSVIVSPRQPYLFSCGEDKQIKCWDLEYNKVIRHYHGHLSAIYCMGLHPTIDVLATGSRDSTIRVWDMRTKACIHILSGHSNTIGSLFMQATDPQIVSGSHDSTVKLWDIASGRCISTLTHHKKSVRALCPHPRLYMFASGSSDNIKQWSLPEGDFMQNMSGHNSIINSISINEDNVLVSGADNGTLHFWDWKSAHNFQRLKPPTQAGSIESEAGIFATTFDKSGTRLITAEADKTIKLYREDEDATEETHPLQWKPELFKRKRY